ncbi:mechanosensitive ion channel family protein [Cecembia lonarensis]|uniref:MscS family inner membrane protein YnaI n=1 Tax=Cecembia lonarensis (strain CCUG 58316 / KCTC 22772 / LW9) TaxID=1225176 RepID=K1L564_CECL9|nr:mechanosensitive ion channel family protein [Cecembia lonarensis]EKB49906.1 MscS family inner membrane protein YnaI [Cecembia lonarensis LW9]
MPHLKLDFTLFVLTFFISSILSAQVILDDQLIPLEESDYQSLSSPYHTTLTFFYNLREDNYDPKVAAGALFLEDKDQAKAERLAVKLKQIFDGNGVYVKISEVPNDPNYIDSLYTNQARFFFDTRRLPMVYLEKINGEWKFSAFTVSNIDEMHKETYPYGTDRLLNILPKMGNEVYLGLHFWQLAGLFLLILSLFVAHKLMTFLLDRGFLYVIRRLGYGYVGEKYLLPVARITSIYLIIVISSLFIRLLQLPIEVVSMVLKLLNAAKPLVVTIVFYKIVDIVALYFARLAQKTESTLDDQLVPLLRKTLKAFVVIVGTLFVLKEGLEVDIVPFLTGLSIGGLAFALAAQDTIKNFFGSIMIFIDKPFQVGDWITSGDVDGTVEEVGFRSTRVRTFRNSVMYIPNGKIADATIDNHGLRQYRRFFTTLTITYDTPPHLVEAFVEGLKQIVANHPDTRKDYYNVYFNNLSSYSQDIMFYIFFEVPTWPEELRCRHEILIQIVKLANSLGVRFAFPTQTLHMESFPEKQTLTPKYAEDARAYKAKLQDFMTKELGKKDN